MRGNVAETVHGLSGECGCYLVIRIRGGVKASEEELTTLKMLNLKRANHATIIPKTPSFEGMLRKVAHYLTWGEPNLKTIKRLLRRMELDGGSRLDDATVKRLGYGTVEELAEKLYRGEVTLSQLREKGLKPYIRLHPPRKGFKGTIKKHFREGGEYGYRGEAINELAVRMA